MSLEKAAKSRPFELALTAANEELRQRVREASTLVSPRLIVGDTSVKTKDQRIPNSLMHDWILTKSAAISNPLRLRCRQW